ncbi:hypothetical protein TELCIR_13415, partial [Teladorsagia circumcincta]
GGRMPVGSGSSRSGRLARISQSNIRPFGSGGAGGGFGPDQSFEKSNESWKESASDNARTGNEQMVESGQSRFFAAWVKVLMGYRARQFFVGGL